MTQDSRPPGQKEPGKHMHHHLSPHSPIAFGQTQGEARGQSVRRHKIPDLTSTSWATGLGREKSRADRRRPGRRIEYRGKAVHAIFPSWKALTLKTSWAQGKPQRALKSQLPGISHTALHETREQVGSECPVRCYVDSGRQLRHDHQL